MAITYAIANAKGGVGKTTTTLNLGVSLSRAGYKVLLVDNDPQKANLTLALGQSAQNLRYTLSTLYCAALDTPEMLLDYIGSTIIQGKEIDFIPANKKLSGIATRLSIEKGIAPSEGSGAAPELTLRTIVQALNDRFDYILIDCGPKLDMLMTNALTAANQVIIPVQSHYLAMEGISDVMETVRYVRKEYNSELNISGILLTMYQGKTKLCQSVRESVQEQFGTEFRIFSQPVTYSIKVAEHPVYGESLFKIDPDHPAALAYAAMAEEVLSDA